MTPGGWVYHVLNRSVGRMRMFRTDKDFLAFQQIICQAHAKFPIRILSYCIMSSHWHFVVWPQTDGEVTAFFRWLAHTHAMRWRVSHRTVGYGHLYQGRFKSFPVQEDGHFLTVCRYVERNAMTAGQCRRAEDWPWSSLWVRREGPEELRAILSDWPVNRPRNWIDLVNKPMTDNELDRMQVSLVRNRPFGGDAWVGQTVRRLSLEHTVRPEGRPKGKTNKSK